MNKSTLAFGILIGAIITISSSTLAKNFPDVSNSDWFFDYVQKIEQWGIIAGNDDGTFAPGRSVVRAELAKMFVLLDERTDRKIEASQASTQMRINESFKAIETNAIETPLPSVMTLRKRNNPAATCPPDWTQTHSGYVGSNDLRVNTRTCLTSKRCEILTVTQHRNSPPQACPENWLEADYGLVEDQDMERVCFICAS